MRLPSGSADQRKHRDHFPPSQQLLYRGSIEFYMWAPFFVDVNQAERISIYIPNVLRLHYIANDYESERFSGCTTLLGS